MTGFRLNDRVPITRLKSLTQFDDISIRIKRTKLTWYGHLRRSLIPAKTITEGLTSGFRKRGRPSRRWIKDLTEWTGKPISELSPMAYDRNEWRQLCNQVLWSSILSFLPFHIYVFINLITVLKLAITMFTLMQSLLSYYFFITEFHFNIHCVFNIFTITVACDFLFA